MSRWGNEEKKTKGLFGCTVSFLVTVVLLALFMNNYSKLEVRRDLAKAVEKIARNSYNTSAPEIHKKIIQAGQEIGADLNHEDVYVEKLKDGSGNWIVEVYIPIEIEVTIFVTEFTMPYFPISETITLIQ